MLEHLKVLCESANERAFKLCGHRATYILTSAGLIHALRELGYKAEPVRVRCSVHSEEHRNGGTVLGSDGDGSCRPAAGRDMWHGHLAVVVEDRYLLDPTIDQAGYGKYKGNHWIRVPPLAADFGDGFAREFKGHFIRWGNADLCYNVRREQVGFKSAPDWKHKSHWWPVAKAVIERGKSLAIPTILH